uniref:Uncharacterized protein n=1 Tax=Tetranychus urticae TaxID=32264 RepID=T1KFM9_TETUR
MALFQRSRNSNWLFIGKSLYK